MRIGGKGLTKLEGEAREIRYLAEGWTNWLLIERASQQRQLVGNLCEMLRLDY